MNNPKALNLLLIFLLSASSLCFSDDVSRQRKEAFMETYQNWTVPIKFYGQALDQDSLPVADVKVCITVTYYDPTQEFFESDKVIDLVTDENGKFELTDQGRQISIKLEKAGYEYPYGVASVNFYNYGKNTVSDPIHQPDPATPEVIYLHKKPCPAYLSGSGPSLERASKTSFDVADGFETQFYITEGYYDAYGKDGLMPDGITTLEQDESRRGDKDIQVSGSMPSANMYEFEFIPLVANSGLILSDDRLEQAPDSGYVNSIAISVPTDNTADFDKYIYAKISDTSYYSRLDVKIMIRGRGRGQLIITSWTNPAGSRNLKYDEEHQYYEETWRQRLADIRYAATKLKGESRDKYLIKYELGDILGIKPDGTFNETLFRHEADALKAKLKAEDPRWWHALEE